MQKDLARCFQEAPRPADDLAIVDHLPLVRRIAYRLSAQMPRSLDLQDLIGAGVIGLVQAARDYDAAHKSSFKTYASIRIRGAILDAIRERDPVPRSVRDRYKQYVRVIQDLENRLGRQPEDEEIRKELGLSKRSYEIFLDKARPLSFLSLDDLPLSRKDGEPASGEGPYRMLDPGFSAEFSETRGLLAGAIGDLPEREQRVIQLYYYEELNLKEIGRVLGIGESRVCQLHTQALMRLKGSLNRGDVSR